MLKTFLQENQFDLVFFRNSYRRFIIVALFMLVINYIILGYMFWSQTHIVLPQNFVTTSDGRVIAIYPIDR
jgi:hypothetical protein